MTTCTSTYTAPHGTEEPWPFEVTHLGTKVTTDLDACLLPASDTDAPAEDSPTWQPAILTDGQTHVSVAGHQPGWYSVWVQLNRGGRRILIRLEPDLYLS